MRRMIIMGNKYNFTDGYNKGVKDKSPDWMEELFNNKIEKKEPVIINDLYGVDMNETQKSKLITDIPKIDIAIKMGCNVVCPYLEAEHVEDWGLEDPTGKSDEEFIRTAKIIEEKVKDLAERIKNNQI